MSLQLRTYSRDFQTEFIQLYQNCPCLWKVKSKDYRDHEKKNQAYELLVAKLREVDSNATRETVKNKIRYFKATYRKELLKLETLRQSFNDADDIFIPSVWYFNLLTFMNSEDILHKSTSKADGDSKQSKLGLRHFPHDFLTEFIELYKSLPCLWNVKSKHSKNSETKNEAYQILVAKYQEFEPGATRSTVTKTINSLRAQYRKEFLKSVHGNNLYTPTVWYFNLLTFLGSGDVSKLSTCSKVKISDTLMFSGAINTENVGMKVFKTECMEEADQTNVCNNQDINTWTQNWYDDSCVFIKQEDFNTSQNSELSEEMSVHRNNEEVVSGAETAQVGRDTTTDHFTTVVSSKQKRLKKKLLKCEVCGKLFSFNYQLSRHKMVHTGERPYQCDICGKGVNNIGHLREHTRVHTGEKPYECNVCGARFSQNSILYTHKKIHMGRKPFKCDICDATFLEKAYLKRHYIVHTGEKPYKCDVCGVKFSKNGILKRHKRIHTGEKPYKCDVCGVGFSDNGLLKKHKRIHTGEKPYKCDVCGAKFTQSWNLKVHRKVHARQSP